MGVRKYSINHPQLKEFVSSVVVWSNDEQSLTNSVVLPSIACGLGFTLKGSLKVKYGDDFILAPSFGTRNILSRNQQILVSDNFLNVSVRFTPDGLSCFTNQILSEHYKYDFIEMNSLIKDSVVKVAADKLMNANSDIELVQLMEDFLISQLKYSRDNRIADGVRIIEQQKGNVNVAELSYKLNSSERNLNRLFNKTVGFSIKEIAKVAQFRNFYKLLKSESPKDLNLARLSVESGYFDQAHAIKVFKNFTGLTPLKYMQNPSLNLSDFYNAD